MNKFSEWIEEKDPELCEGLGLMKIIKALIPKGSMTIMQSPGACGMSLSQQSSSATVKGTGPNEKSARQNALEKLGHPEDAKVDLIDKENDVYTFKVKMR